MRGCRLGRVWLGYKVWREMSRLELSEPSGLTAEAALFPAVLPIIEQLPAQVAEQVKDQYPAKRKPSVGAMVFSAIFLFSGLLFTAKVLGEVGPAVMETLFTRPGQAMLIGLIGLGLWRLTVYLFRQARRFRDFVSMLCWLGGQAELAAAGAGS